MQLILIYIRFSFIDVKIERATSAKNFFFFFFFFFPVICTYYAHTYSE